MAYELKIGARPGAAGVSGNLRDSAPSSIPQALGTAMIVGAFGRGPTNRVIVHPSKGHCDRVRGPISKYNDSKLTAEQFYERSQGKGTLLTYRIDDGDSEVAELILFDRNVEQGDLKLIGAQQLPAKVVQVKSLFAGAGYGQAHIRKGYVADLDAAITGSTFTPGGAAMVANQWRGAYLSFTQAPSFFWTIKSNTTTTITINGAFTGFTPAASPSSWGMRKYNADYFSDASEQGLSLKVKDGAQNTAKHFGFDAFDGGKAVEIAGTQELSFDPSENFMDTVIKNTELNETNWEYQVVDYFTRAGTGDFNDPKQRPANFAEVIESVTGNVIKFKCWRNVLGSANTGDAYVSSCAYPGMIPTKAVLTGLGGAAFSVKFYDIDGVIALDNGTLPNGTVGAAWTYDFLPSFSVTAPTAFDAADVISVYFRPFPTSLTHGLLSTREARLYPFAFSPNGGGAVDTDTWYPIIENTYDTVTVPLGTDLSALKPLALPLGSGTVAGDFNVQLETFIFQIDDGAGLAPAVTLTLNYGVPTVASAAVLAAKLDTLDVANDLIFGSDATNHLTVTLSALHPSYGPNAKIKVTTGTLNPIIGVVDNTVYAGATPTVSRVEWRQELCFGVDGDANTADSDWSGTIFDPSATLLEDALEGQGLGLVTVGLCEGKDSGGSVITDNEINNFAAIWAKAKGHMFVSDLDASLITEATARLAVKTNRFANRHVAFLWPTYGYLSQNPLGASAPYTSTIVGMYLGVLAKVAYEANGYHQAPAGSRATLAPVISSLSYDVFDPGHILDDAMLNNAGIIGIYHKGAQMHPWGDQIPDVDHNGTIWFHKQRSILHILHSLMAQCGQFLYRPVNSALFGEIKAALTMQMLGFFNRGWLIGDSFSQACKIQCDAGNNPAGSGTGTVYASVSCYIVDTAKRVNIELNSTGFVVTEAA